MRSKPLAAVLAHVRLRHRGPDSAAQPDGALLQRFLDDHDEAAFAELVCRHGPMVLAVCRRRLRHEHDAEEAFQATFLLLACKGASVVPRQQVGAWLHGVAFRAASQVRRAALRRREHKRRAEPLIRAASAIGELGDVLDEELALLPEHYRAPLVLCGLEGRTLREAAGALGWPEGSVSGRLTRAKRLLARRLTRRGFGPGEDDYPGLAALALPAERAADALLTAAARL